MENAFVYITAPNHDEANKIGTAIVEKRLAACVNIIDQMTSIYWWENRLNKESEAVIIAKTRTTLVEDLTAFVKSIHSYNVPCIIALPITGGNKDFLEWINDETAKA